MVTTSKNVFARVDAPGPKAELAAPTTPATRLTDASRHLDLAQRMASTRDPEVGAPRAPQATDREPGVPAATVVDEASELSAAAREGAIPLDNPGAHVGPGDAKEAADPPLPQTTLRRRHRPPRGYLTDKGRPIVRLLLPFA